MSKARKISYFEVMFDNGEKLDCAGVDDFLTDLDLLQVMNEEGLWAIVNGKNGVFLSTFKYKFLGESISRSFIASSSDISVLMAQGKFDFNDAKECIKLYCVAQNMDGKFGALGYAGQELIPCEYDDIELLANGSFALVKKVVNDEQGCHRKYGIVNSKNEIVLPIEYDDVDAKYSRAIVKKGNYYGLIDSNTIKFLIPCEYLLLEKKWPNLYDDNTVIKDVWKDEWSSAWLAIDREGKYGVISGNGEKILIPFEKRRIRRVFEIYEEPDCCPVYRIKYVEE